MMFRSIFKALFVGILFTTTILTGCDCEKVVISTVESKLSVNPEQINFGTISVGSVAQQVIEVTNESATDINVSEIVIDPATDQLFVTRVFTATCSNEQRASSLKLTGRECARFEVRYVPTLEAPIAAGTKVFLKSDAETSSIEIPIVGEAVKSSVRVCVLNPDDTVDETKCSTADTLPELDFGAVPKGESRQMKVRIFNDGKGTLVVNGATMQTDFEGQFALKPDAVASLTIGAQGSGDLTIEFTPSGDGLITGELVIPSSDPQKPSLNLPVKGQAQGDQLCLEPPDGLEFGGIKVGSTKTLTMKLKNCGYTNYSLDKITANQDKTLFKLLTQLPTAPVAFAPGAEFSVDVQYAPDVVGDVANQDKLTFLVEPSYRVGLRPYTITAKGYGANPGCESGAPTTKAKVFLGTRDITTNPIVEPLDQVTIDASGSVPGGAGAPLTYVWRLVSQPAQGTAGLSGANPSKRTLFMDLAGNYVVEVSARDKYGCSGAPQTITIKSQPKGKLHVQLTWPQSYGDIDLHVLGPNGVFYDRVSDVFYGNKKPDWGKNGTTAADADRTNDPTLDIDDQWGNGPENITFDSPFDGVYTVVASYYCSRQSNFSGYAANPAGPNPTPNVKIYVNGVDATNGGYTKSVKQADTWEVAKITVAGGNITVAPSTAPVTRAKYFGGAADQVCTSASP